MPLPCDIRSWSDLAPLLIWLAVVHGLAAAIFGPWLISLIGRWMRSPEAAAQLARAAAELRAGALIPDHNRPPARALTELEMRERQELVRRLGRIARPKMLAAKLAGCGFCQRFWCAMLCLAWFGRWAGPSQLVAGALGYAALLSVALAATTPRMQSAGGCGGSAPLGRTRPKRSAEKEPENAEQNRKA